MDATVSPWSTFRQRFQRWQQLAGRGKGPAELARALTAFFRRRVFLAAACIAGISAMAGALGMYWLIGSDLPALRTEFRKVATELYVFHSDLHVADAQQRSALSEHLMQEKASRDAITSSLRALSANSIVLMQMAERRALKPQEVKDLLASVREVSVAEAPKLESITTIGGVISEHSMPLLAFAKQEQDLRELTSFFSAATPSVQPAYLGRLLLTRHGTWHAGDRHILFKWDGGSAKIRTTGLSQGEVARKVELFNSVSRAVSQADVTAPPTYSRQPRLAAKPNATRRTNGSSNAQRRPQPPRRIDVVKLPETAPGRSAPASY